MSRAVLLLATLCIAFFVPAAALPARADAGLTAAIAAAYFPRYEDEQLHAIAHDRVGALVECRCLTHQGMASGTAEVIAYNLGAADPIASVVGQWQRSAPHDEILSNTEYGRIGCAEGAIGGTRYFACVLSFGDLPPAATPAPQGGFLLPNTAVAPPPGG